MAALLAAFVTACSAGGGAGTGVSSPRCLAAADVGIPLAIRLPARPTVDPPPICPLVSYSAVFASAAWGAMPKELRAADPDVQVWQERSLLYSCDRCDAAPFRLPWIRGHHPEWILRTADGAEIHPAEHPGWVLLDFGDAGYQSAWSLRVEQSLTDGGWTGVDAADAGNEPEWSGTPVDPRTGAELEPDDRATYLAQALSLVHAAMRTQGFFLLAQNGPPGIVEPAQINSADAVTAGTGSRACAAKRGPVSSTTTFRCSANAWPRSSSRRSRTSPKRDVYGLAGYLLVATPRGAYALAPGSAVTPLYDPTWAPQTRTCSPRGSARRGRGHIHTASWRSTRPTCRRTSASEPPAGSRFRREARRSPWGAGS